MGDSWADFFLYPGLQACAGFAVAVVLPAFAATAIFQIEIIDLMDAQTHDAEIIETGILIGAVDTALDLVELLAGARGEWGAGVGLPKLGLGGAR